MNLDNFLGDDIPYQILETDEGERIEIHPLGVYNNTSMDLVRIEGYYKPHIHQYSTARLHILKGSGIALLGDEKRKYNCGDILDVPKGTPHGFETLEETIFLSLQNPPITNRDKKVDIIYPKNPSEEIK